LKVLILGAGAAGLSAAWKLAEYGIKVEVLEKDKVVGGLCQTLHKDGYFFDLGGHRFISRDEQVIRELTVLMGDELLTVPRSSTIRLMGRYFQYPLQTADLLKKMSPGTLNRCMLDYLYTLLRHKIRPRPDVSFQDWVTNRFGSALYDIFFGPYTHKLWGVEPSQISARWAAQRISLLNLWDVMIRLLGLGRGNTPKTYIKEFYYPKKGIGQIFERMTEEIEARGNKVRLGCEVLGLTLKDRRIESVEYKDEQGKHTVKADHIISTLPLPDVVRFMKPAVGEKYLQAAEGLKFRSLRFLFLYVDKEEISDNTWVYLPDKEYLPFRLQEPKKWSRYAAPAGKTSMTLEIACFEGDDIWNAPASDLVDRGTADLEKLGLLKREEVTGFFDTKVKHGYPIHDLEADERVDLLLNFVDSFENITTIGRQGFFRYNNMDHSVKMGFMAAEHLLKHARKSDIQSIATQLEAFEGDVPAVNRGDRAIKERLAEGTDSEAIHEPDLPRA